MTCNSLNGLIVLNKRERIPKRQSKMDNITWQHSKTKKTKQKDTTIRKLIQQSMFNDVGLGYIFTNLIGFIDNILLKFCKINLSKGGIVKLR